MVRVRVTCTQARNGVISFSPVKEENRENKEVFQSSPGGTMTLNIVKLDTTNKFREGGEYVVSFEDVSRLEEDERAERLRESGSPDDAKLSESERAEKARLRAAAADKGPNQ